MTAYIQLDFLRALGWAVINSLWQLAFLWVLYQIIIAVFRFRKASFKASLATILLFAGFGWFIFNFFALLVGKPAVLAYSTLINLESNAAANEWLANILPFASAIYLLLLTVPLMNFIRNYRYVQIIRTQSISKADVQWRMFVRKVAAQMGIRKSVQVLMSELVNSPVTIGYLKPVILLPLASVNHLTISQTEAVLLHELSHIRRFDYLVNLITRIIQTVLYFNPFVKAFSQIIEREREKSCDEMVLQFQYEPHGYASALLALEKASTHNNRTLAVAAAGGHRQELLGRIETILGIEKKSGFSMNKLAGVMAALVCFLGLNALLIWSQPRHDRTGNGMLAQVSSPFLVFGEESQSPDASEINPLSIQNIAMQDDIPVAAPASQAKDMSPVAGEEIDVNESESTIVPQFVALRENVLNAEEEKQVKEALEVSRRVLEEGQWKNVERSIADALTEAEKSKVKEAFYDAAENANWVAMENKLRESYDKINWPAVQQQLNTALSEIKLDSLQKVYNLAIVNLAELKKEMEKTNQLSVPDTDLTLKVVDQRKREAEKAVNRLKSLRERKVVRL